MKNIAIILFGQPRYLEVTWPLIKQEFLFNKINVDFYIHFWDQIGYTPQSNEANVSEEIVNILNTEFSNDNVQLQDYTELDELCLSLKQFYNILLSERIVEDPLEDLRYRFGQHLSINKAYEQIKKYEENNKFKYDLIIKTRSDIVYRTPRCYRYDTDYYNTKKTYYLDEPANFDKSADGFIKCNALRIMDFRKKFNETADDISQVIETFYNNKYCLLNKENVWNKLPEDYFIRIAVNDWLLTASRTAADVFFGDYFKNFNFTVVKDLLKNPTPEQKKRLISSEHCLQGQFLSNYNILASLHMKDIRRDIRLLNKNEIKPDVITHGKLLCDDNVTTEYLEDAIVRGWSLNKRTREITAKEMETKYGYS